jgi:hypothetical protein
MRHLWLILEMLDVSLDGVVARRGEDRENALAVAGREALKPAFPSFGRKIE